MKILVTGAGGQVGRVLMSSVPQASNVVGLTHADLDISDSSAVARAVHSQRPDFVICVGAYTAVDRAESEPEAAARVNADGPRNLALAAREAGARLLHISTDFVFDGQSSTAYRPDSTPNPQSTYGRTKLDGERAVQEILPNRSVIIRTSWVYAAEGNNFVRTMLRLMTAKGHVRVVADQIGAPTSATSLVEVIWALSARPELAGLYHWSDAGVASWYDFAVAIAEEAAAMGLLPAGVRVDPITTADYPTPARRPCFSLLDSRALLAALGLSRCHWRTRLRAVLKEISHA